MEFYRKCAIEKRKGKRKCCPMVSMAVKGRLQFVQFPMELAQIVPLPDDLRVGDKKEPVAILHYLCIFSRLFSALGRPYRTPNLPHSPLSHCSLILSKLI